MPLTVTEGACGLRHAAQHDGERTLQLIVGFQARDSDFKCVLLPLILEVFCVSLNEFVHQNYF